MQLHSWPTLGRQHPHSCAIEGAGIRCSRTALPARCCSLNPQRPAAASERRLAALRPSRPPRRACCRAAEGGNQLRYSGDLPAAAEQGPKEGMGKALVLGLLFSGWYLFNIYFNIYNKQVLKAFPYPFTSTSIQFGVGSCIALALWTFGLLKKPEVDKDLVVSILPLAAVHTLGNLLTNVSLGKVAVSFTHTIKAMEPFFSVVLSALFLGDRPTPAVVASLLPIVGGVALASATEASFNWPGFLSAMGSNLTFQSRNVFSKKFMGKRKGSLDNINLFSIITLMSFFLLLPFTLAREGFHATPAALRAAGVADAGLVFKRALLAGVCFHSYQQVSYMILQRVSPVTHSVGNCLKRVIVIVASVIFFQNPVGRQNQIGTAVALAGVFLYSQIKRLQQRAKAKAAAP